VALAAVPVWTGDGNTPLICVTLEVKDAEAHEQHKSIISALKAAALEWEFEQINFVVGNRRSVVESDFYTKLKNLDIHKEKKTSSSAIM